MPRLLLVLLSLLSSDASNNVLPQGSLSFNDNQLDREMTVHVDAGKEDCYYETLNVGDVIDVDYQVVDGGANNELYIDFKLLKPNGIPLVADYRQPDNTHRHDITEQGDYRMCFDNSASRFSAKIVFFNVIVEKPDGDDDDEEAFQPPASPEQYDMSVADIDAKLKSIHGMVAKTKKFQDQIRAQEFRDRQIAERNFERVNFWSVVQVLIMVVAGAVQVMLLRSLFDEKSMLHGLWKRIC